MIYKKYKDLKISQLAMGTMRLPDSEKNVNEEHVQKMVDYAIEKGVNYFDTGYDYHLGKSEVVIGKCLSKYPRDSYYLVDKFPGYNLQNMDKVEEIFEEQLQRCGVEYFDFYLFHNVCELNVEQYLDPKYGIHEYLMKQKEAGRIKHLGFSSHGELEVIERFLKEYGDDMEFAQIQLNYMDYQFQNAKEKVELLHKYGLPIMVMEPMRGGRLAKLADSQEMRLKELRPEESIPAWANRFLQSLPDVLTVLTGSSSLEQLAENIANFEEEKPLTEKEMEVLNEIVQEMMGENTVPCTACNYCEGHCPIGLDIPKLLALYNEHSFTGGGFIAPFVIQTIPEDKRPDKCIGCGSCQLVCPQKIEIWKTMGKFANMLKA